MKKQRMSQITEALKAVYPQAACALEWNGEPWKLLIMGRLSAQCTDARVNLVCKELFERYPTPKELAEAPLSELEKIIRPCGLYHVKAQNVKDACRMLVEDFHGTIPHTMEELLKFPGVGRKVANLLLGDLYGTGGIVADTHCIRICGRFGMYPETLKDPVKVEKIMNELVLPAERCDFCHRVVQFGRDVCSARAPRCAECPIRTLCEHAKKQ
ncbi:MAG: endonuclease III [Ruminococcaceae bacterium]|nr:endonuclease III [Oscillospiraceae bacterium]